MVGNPDGGLQLYDALKTARHFLAGGERSRPMSSTRPEKTPAGFDTSLSCWSRRWMPGNRIYPQPRRGPTTDRDRLRARRAGERPATV